MTNIIRADIYRILRSKALYITVAVLLGFVALTVGITGSATIGMEMSVVDETVYNDVFKYDGLNIAEVLYKQMNILVYIMLSLIILVSAAMFSHDTVKNELSFGISRVKLYISKLILSSGVCVLLMLLYMAFGMLLATSIYGFGGPAPEGYWTHILIVCAAKLLMLLGFNCFGTFLVFTAKRTAIVNGAYIAFCLVPSIVIHSLTYLSSDFGKLFDYDLMTALQKMGYLDMLPSADIFKALIVGTFYIVASTIAGLALFNRAEIK